MCNNDKLQYKVTECLYFTFKGHKKRLNEDRVFCKHARINDITFGLAVVADGVGAYGGGGFAANYLVKALVKSFKVMLQKVHYSTIDAHACFSFILQSLECANRELYYNNINSEKGYYTTCSLCFVYGDNVFLAHIGDTRIYRISTEVILLTSDHHVKGGRALSRCIGLNRRLTLDFIEYQIEHNQNIILLSDGVYHNIDFSQLRMMTCAQHIFNNVITQLENVYLSDNISFIVLEIAKVKNV